MRSHMLITLFRLMWHLILLACVLAGAGVWLAARRKRAGSRWRKHKMFLAATILWAAILVTSIIGSYLSFIPAEETFTYLGGMAPVSDKFTEDFETPFHYVYVQSGFLDHEGQRFYLNLFRFAFPHLTFEPRAGTVNIYRTAQEDRIVGLNSQMESYDNMLIAAYREAGQPIDYETSYTVLTTYDMFPDASAKLKPGDVIAAYDGIPMNGRSALDRYIREHRPDSIVFDIVRNGEPMSVEIELFDPFGYGGYHTLGFAVAENKTYDMPDNALPIPDRAKHSGSSSGLMMALEVYSRLTDPDLGKGFTIAGTGGITLDGKVTTIGSLYHKVVTVIAEGADLFLVPKEQEREALRIQQESGNTSTRIVGVSTLAEAVAAIEALEPAETDRTGSYDSSRPREQVCRLLWPAASFGSGYCFRFRPPAFTVSTQP